MNNELQKSWDELISDYSTRSKMHITKQGCALLAADKLIKEQQAHIERLREALSNLEQAAKYTADAHGVDVYADLCETAGEACRVLNETPAQSLEAVNQGAQQ